MFNLKKNLYEELFLQTIPTLLWVMIGWCNVNERQCLIQVSNTVVDCLCMLIDLLFHCFIAYKYICVVLWLLVSKSPLTNSKQSIKTGSCPTVYFLCTLPPSQIFQLKFVLFCVPSDEYGEASGVASVNVWDWFSVLE